MIEVNGKYTNAKIMIDQVDEGCMGQIIQMINHEAFTNPVRIMPDTHQGAGSVIGFTMPMGDKLIPNVVGVDLGCFVGNTKIPLLNGFQESLINLIGKIFYVYSLDENLKIVPGLATAIKTKENSELYEIIISGGETIICTPDQLLMLTDGTYKETKDLKIKDSLMPLYRTYDSKDGYELVSTGGRRPIATHHVIGELLYGKRPYDYHTHHKDNCWYNNTPENIEYLTKNKHCSITALNRNYFTTEEFKEKKKVVMDEKGFYFDPKFLKKKQDVARKNISEYMKSEEWKEDFKDNGTRGSEFLKIENEKIFECECGKKIKGKGSFGKHKKSCNKKNHKVLSIKKLDYKEDVYCLQVEKYHNFAISAGVFVHNCGMLSYNIGKIDLNHKELDEKIRYRVPFGINVRKNPILNLERNFRWDYVDRSWSWEWFEKLCKRVEIDPFYAQQSISTLGGGNHFLEIGKSASTGDTWITVHSGSRNLGKKICEYWQKRASLKEFGDPKEAIKSIKDFSPKSEWDKRIKELHNKIKNMKSSPLDFLKGIEKDFYLEDMKLASWYAKVNRTYIMHEIIFAIENKELNGRMISSSSQIPWIESVHNYIDFKDNIIRKGAIRSYVGEKMIIPFNMRDGILICEGKSNPDWNFSAPHGAGRVYSRSKAKGELNLEKFEKDMEGIFSTSICRGTIDESPDAYKDSKIIEEAIEPTAKILDRIIPIHNMKDASEEKPWKKKIK